MRSGRSARRSSNSDTDGKLLLEACDELLEAQLLEALADRVELAGAELDQAAALADEVERFAQAGLAGVQALDDRLQARGRRLVGLRLLVLSHRPRSLHPRRRRRRTAAPRPRGARAPGRGSRSRCARRESAASRWPAPRAASGAGACARA